MDACSKCAGTGWEPVEGNGVRQVRRCACSIEQQKRQLLSLVPVRYRDARLKNLMPRQDQTRCFAPLEIQEQAIAMLKNQPDDSYCFLAGVGFAKSHYLSALYRHAVETQGNACFFVQVNKHKRVEREDTLPRFGAKTYKPDFSIPVQHAGSGNRAAI